VAFVVAEEDLQAARAEALAALAATRESTVNDARYDWLYGRNPDGPAVLWTIRRAETGQFAGFTVALPRRVLVDKTQLLAWNGADFSMLPSFRTLGLAMKLRRAAKEGIDAGRAAFLYSHPNERMQRIHEQVGHREVGTMVRWARPLRSEPQLESRIHNRFLRAGIAWGIDHWLAQRGGLWRHRPQFALSVQENATFDERFDRLQAETNLDRPVIGVRDAAYLNWRFAQNPLYRTHAVLAQAGPRLAAYLLFCVVEGHVHIKDWFGDGNLAAAADVLAHLIRLARDQDYHSVSSVLLDGHPWIPLLERFGFYRRPETSQMFGYARPGDVVAARALAGKSWFATVGDRDV
jgi:hypothetical protein